MGKNNSKRKARTEVSKMTSVMAKLDNQLRRKEEAQKERKANKKNKK